MTPKPSQMRPLIELVIVLFCEIDYMSGKWENQP